MDGIISFIVGIILVGIILYLTYLTTKLVSMKSVNLASSKYITIIDRIVLGQDRYIAIAKINKKHYLLSITSTGINILKEFSEFDELDINEMQKFPSFQDILSDIVKKKKDKE